MNENTARDLTLYLNALFPSPPMSELTFAAYVSEITMFKNEEAATEAIQGLGRTSHWLPKIVDIREAYERIAIAYAERREALAREEAREFSLTHGLPVGEDREPIPAETVEWLRERGIDVAGLVKRIDAA